MRTKIFLSFNTGQRPWPVVQRLFESAGCTDLVRAGPSLIHYYSVKLWADDPKLVALRAGLQAADIDWSEREERHYTPAELRQAPLLWLAVRRAPKGEGGARYGTQYDLSTACPVCGTGAVQTSPLVLRPSDAPKTAPIFETLDGEILVNATIAAAFRAAGVRGVELRQAVSSRDRSPLPWWQLLAAQALPPMAPETEGVVREKPCPRCDRDGYFGTVKHPKEIRYRANEVDVASLPDVVRTYEYFGRSGLHEPFEKSVFADPLLLVTPKVYDIFQELKVRRVEFTPIEIIED